MNDKRTQKDIRRNRRRRGVVIEMALLMMAVVVAFSGLLTSTAIMQLNKQNSSKKELELLQQRAVLDQIGRDFCEQREHYALPAGVNGKIIQSGCDGCCADCDECEAIYEISETLETSVAEDDTEDTESAEGNGDGVSEAHRTGCCNNCGCRTGCTQYTHIELVVYDEDDNPVLTVIMSHDVEYGTHTVTYWSYGG